VLLGVFLDAVSKQVSPIAAELRNAEAQHLRTRGEHYKMWLRNRNASGSSNGTMVVSAMKDVMR